MVPYARRNGGVSDLKQKGIQRRQQQAHVGGELPSDGLRPDDQPIYLIIAWK